MGSSDQSKKKKDVTISKVFDVDSETTGLKQMPGITRLLNRKSLNNSNPLAQDSSTARKQAKEHLNKALKDVQKLEEPLTQSVDSSSQEGAPSPAPKAPVLTIKKASRARTGNSLTPSILKLWETEQLTSSPDPLARGLHSLLQAGAHAALFLVLKNRALSGSHSSFSASAAYNPGSRASLWQGLGLESQLMPHVWQQLTQIGFLEIAAREVNAGEKHTLCTSLGSRSDEMITIVRVGPPEECRGLLTLFSKKSILSRLKEVLPWLSAASGSTTRVTGKKSA